MSLYKNRRISDKEVKDLLASLVQPTVNEQPNLHALNLLVRDLKAIHLNVKNFGYLLAREIRDVYESDDPPAIQRKIGLQSKLTTQADIESDWLRYWCQQLKIQPIYHRKIWELCYVAQAIYEYSSFDEPRSGIGFGCGEEPLPSLFASFGHTITVTDLHPDRVKGLGWAETAQHTDNLGKVHFADIIDRATFDRQVNLKYVDMNAIPKDLDEQYDYCWSVCALEHLGSISKGLDFVKNSMRVLKPGGVAVHTTEFNYTNEPETIDNWPTVIFQQNHIEKLADELHKSGYEMAPLNFNAGDGILDRFIDIPPYSFGEGWLNRETWGDVNQGAHLKMSLDGFPCTCIGLIVRKPA